jgi:hypothetical protein
MHYFEMFNHFSFFHGEIWRRENSLIDESNAIFIDLHKEREKITHKKPLKTKK